MSDLVTEYNKLKAIMDENEQDRLWDHFVQTGQVLPTTHATLTQINKIQKQILDIEKLQYTYPFPNN